MNDGNIIQSAKLQTNLLRELATERVKCELERIIDKNDLILEQYTSLDDKSPEEFVKIILQRNREQKGDTESDENNLTQCGAPCLDNRNKKRKDEKRHYDEKDEFEIDFGTSGSEQSENFTEAVQNERSNMWKNLYNRNMRTSPCLISSGVGAIKLNTRQRQLLMKHSGLSENRKPNAKNIDFRKNEKDVVREKAGLTKQSSDKAKNIIIDLKIKKLL